MSGQGAFALRIAASFIWTLSSGFEAQARSQPRHPPRPIDGADATASVILDRLSVKVLGLDKPWDPKICIGCDGRAASTSRPGFARPR